MPKNGQQCCPKKVAFSCPVPNLFLRLNHWPECFEGPCPHCWQPGPQTRTQWRGSGLGCRRKWWWSQRSPCSPKRLAEVCTEWCNTEHLKMQHGSDKPRIVWRMLAGYPSLLHPTADEAKLELEPRLIFQWFQVLIRPRKCNWNYLGFLSKSTRSFQWGALPQERHPDFPYAI